MTMNAKQNYKWNELTMGTCYYPEHWDESLWVKDADMMHKAGVKIVRMAEFAWSRLEPDEGDFDFEWLDRAVKLFEDRDMLFENNEYI